MDQNEKLVMYGVVFVAAIDGYSNYILAHETMGIKNNMRIYQSVYKPFVDNFAFPETVIVDHGREFYLSLFMQQYFGEQRFTNRMPYKQVRSIKNNMIERYWVEQNNRVGYPIKRAMIMLENDGIVDAENQCDLFSISQVCQAVAKHGSMVVADSWNRHSVPGKGRPIDLVDLSHVHSVGANWLPDVDEAVNLYETNGGLNQSAIHGNLRDESEVGRDLLADNDVLKQRRQQEFWDQYMSNAGSMIPDLFGAAVNQIYGPIQNAVITHINVTSDIARRNL